MAEAQRRLEAEIDRADREWQRPGSAVRRMTDEQRAWALDQSIRCIFVELFGLADGEQRWRQHMGAADRGALQ